MASDIASTESFEGLVERAKLALQENDQAHARFCAVRQAHWEKLVGPAAKEMMLNRGTAESFLLDANPHIRIVALEVLADHWKPDANLAGVAEKLMFDDPVPMVRSIAMSVLGRCFSGTKNPRIAKLLAGVVNHFPRSKEFRQGAISAYLSLFNVMGLPMESWPDPIGFSYPDDVDWAFLDRLQTPRK